jgi:hypothetical protein
MFENLVTCMDLFASVCFEGENVIHMIEILATRIDLFASRLFEGK